MPITTANLVERCRRRLLERGDTIDADLESFIGDALADLGTVAATDPDPRVRAYAQADANFAMVAGAAPLVAAPQVIREHILRITHPTHGVLQPAGTVSYLDAEKSGLYFWWAIENDTVFGRFGDGVTFPDDATIVVRHSFTPTLANLHAQLENDLINILIGLAQAGGGVQPTPQQQAPAAGTTT